MFDVSFIYSHVRALNTGSLKNLAYARTPVREYTGKYYHLLNVYSSFSHRLFTLILSRGYHYVD